MSGTIYIADGVEKKDSEMESGIESDPDDDPSSLNDATRAAAAAAAALQLREHTSSIDELIESLMVPPPPPSSPPPVDTDTLNELAQLVRASPPSSSPTGTFHCPPETPPQRSEDNYSELVIPPPPPSEVNNADVEAFLAKIIACNGFVGPETVGVVPGNGLNVAGSKYFGRQMSEPAHSGFRQLAEIQSSRTDNGAAVSEAILLPYSVHNGDVGPLAHYRCTSTMNSIEGIGLSKNQKGYFAQPSISARARRVCEVPPALQTCHNDQPFNPYQCEGAMNGAEGTLWNNSGHSSQSDSASEVPSASNTVVSNYGRALRTPGMRSLLVDRTGRALIPPVSATTVRSPMLPRRDDARNSGSLTRSIGRRRPPPPPPPRTSSVQNSPALSCRSEQLTRRCLPRPVGGEDRLTPLPTPPVLARSALIRPGALRSSFTVTKEPTANTATCSPSSPDWNFRRSQSLTESAPAGRSNPTARRSSLLAAIGSRLRSYWSPSTPKHLRDRPATATGDREPASADYRRPSQLDVPSRYSVGTRPGEVLLADDDDTDETYLSFDIALTSRQLRTSPTMSSFSSFTGE